MKPLENHAFFVVIFLSLDAHRRKVSNVHATWHCLSNHIHSKRQMIHCHTHKNDHVYLVYEYKLPIIFGENGVQTCNSYHSQAAAKCCVSKNTTYNSGQFGERESHTSVHTTSNAPETMFETRKRKFRSTQPQLRTWMRIINWDRLFFSSMDFAVHTIFCAKNFAKPLWAINIVCHKCDNKYTQ